MNQKTYEEGKQAIFEYLKNRKEGATSGEIFHHCELPEKIIYTEQFYDIIYYLIRLKIIEKRKTETLKGLQFHYFYVQSNSQRRKNTMG